MRVSAHTCKCAHVPRTYCRHTRARNRGLNNNFLPCRVSFIISCLISVLFPQKTSSGLIFRKVIHYTDVKLIRIANIYPQWGKFVTAGALNN